MELLRRAGLIPERSPERLRDLSGWRGAARARGGALFAARGIARLGGGVSPGAAYGGAKDGCPKVRRGGAGIGRLSALWYSVPPPNAHFATIVARGCGGLILAGATTLREFIDMTAACELFLTNDSGAMHIAAGAGSSFCNGLRANGRNSDWSFGFARPPVSPAGGLRPCKLRDVPSTTAA